MRHELINPGDLVISSWKIFLRNLNANAKFAALFVFVSIVTWSVGILTETAVEDRFARLFINTVVSLPLAIIYLTLTAALIDLTAKAIAKRKVAVYDELMIGAHRVFPFLWVSFLAGIITGASALLLLVPGVIFYVWYKFAAYFTVIDDIRGRAALTASRKIVSGRWLAVFVRIAVPLLFYLIAAAFAQSLLFLLIGSAVGNPGLFVGTLTSLDQLPYFYTLVKTIVPQFIQALTLPLLIAADLLLWNNLKETI